MAITFQTSYLEVSEVTDIVVTPTQQDEEVGDYRRDIRIMDETGKIVLQLRVRSIIRDQIDISAPAQEF
jgi:predicted DNA-binding ArsR family transcriptional regulator